MNPIAQQFAQRRSMTPGQMASHGQYEDDEVAHVATGELVIPNQIIDEFPNILAAFISAMKKKGVDWRQYQVGGEDDAVNPETGARQYEFGSNEDRGYGGSDDSGGFGGSDNNDGRFGSDLSSDYGGSSQPTSYGSDEPSGSFGFGGGDDGRFGNTLGGGDQGSQPSTMDDVRTLAAPLFTGERPRPANAAEIGSLGRMFQGVMTSPFSTPGLIGGGVRMLANFARPGMEAMGFTAEDGPGGPRNDEGSDNTLQSPLMSPARMEAMQAQRQRTRPVAMAAPGFLGLGGMSPLQQRTSIATRALGGDSPLYRSQDASDYYDNLLLRAMITDSGGTGSLDDVSDIEKQYLTQSRNIAMPGTVDALLEALSAS